jgi:phage-related tail protein
MIPFGINHELEDTGNKLDHIEQYIEQLGQQFKRCSLPTNTRSRQRKQRPVVSIGSAPVAKKRQTAVHHHHAIRQSPLEPSMDA